MLLLFSEGQAQKMKLDNVTQNELLEKRNPIDTSASAAYLFKKAKTTFVYSEKEGFVSTTEFQVKLKIYKKEGLKWANFKIPYYIGYTKLSDDSVNLISANTYNLENDKVIKTKVNSDGKFKEQLNEYWSFKSITFPNVKVGSIIELKYVLSTENISVLPEFQFQYDIPVNDAEYTTEIPEFYIYKGIQNGFVHIDKEEILENTSQNFEGKYNESKSFRYRQIKTKYTAKNVPAVKDEAYVNNINNYYGKINHELQTIRMPEEEPKQIAKSWEDVARSIYEEKEFGEELKKKDYFIDHLKTQIANANTLEERANKVFNYVKNRMSWNGAYGYFPKRKLETAYFEKTGNIAEINLMLVAMLKMAGLQADPVLVSTRDNGFALFPNRSLFNYVIAAVVLENKTILFDASDKWSDANLLPERTLNGSGRLIKNDGTSTVIDLMPKSNSLEILNIMATVNPLGEISGKIRDQYFDYNALEFREKYNGIATESYIENIEKQHPGLEINDYEVLNNNDLSKPIIESYSFITTNVTENIGDTMYLSPFLYFAKTENPFKQVTREYPIDFKFPFQYKFNISITIPDGYLIEVLPLPKAVTMPDNIGSFRYNINNINGNQIQLLFTIDINQAVITPEYYEALKNFYKEIVNKQTEKIVLKKS